MSAEIYSEFKQFLDARLSPDSSLLLAISGGIDSMVMLDLARRYALENKIRISVAHFNHQLRGGESDGDEAFVRQSAKDLKFAFVGKRANVQAFALKNKVSIEMAARQLRHEFLAQSALKLKSNYVALAHHADDQAELFFLRLLRGSGLEGLGGMRLEGPSPAHPEVQICRPLIHLTRARLLAYANDKKILFREDSSNSATEHLRNRVRHKLLPFLKKEFQPASVETIQRLMEIVRGENSYMDAQARIWMDKPMRVPFHKLHMALQRRVLVLQLHQLEVSTEFDLVEHLRLQRDTPIMIFPGATLTCDVQGIVWLQTCDSSSFLSGERECQLRDQSGSAILNGLKISWEIQEHLGGFDKVTGEADCEYFDAALVGPTVIMRHWKPGDRFQPIGMKKSVKLQDLWVNAKIPKDQRHSRVVATTATGAIFWVQGLRIGELFKLDKSSIKRLKWKWRCLPSKLQD